jgi:hypothetical protein
MKGKNMKRMNAVKSIRGLVLVLTMAANLALAGNANPKVLPPNSAPYGKSYGEWGAAWWQWAVSFPYEVNPVYNDPTGAFAGLGQSGPVWFLAGTGGTNAVRACTVPAGKGLFFPILNIMVDYPCPEPPVFQPAPGQTMEDFLTQWAHWYIDHVTALAAEVDGVALQGLEKYRAYSKMFYVTMDPSLIVVDPCNIGPTPQPAVSEGYWIMLAPLTPGNHLIHFTGRWLFTQEPDGFDWDFTVDVTYYLTVGKD